MSLVHPDKWNVRDGIELEKTALDVTKSSTNNIVIAGPGAGKTELLAQRACYLLETGVCCAPSKILAISFKKDAAANLAERVKKRCGKELSRRFESITYDTFAKHILDQFRLALDKEYRPSKNYNILLKDNEIAEIADKYITNCYPDYPNWRNIIRRNSELSNLLCNTVLPLAPIKPEESMQELLNNAMWDILLRKMENGESSLTFPMISKLSDYLLRENPYIRKALGMTYSHVFLDEFQDTTDIQYSLLKTSFLESKATLTAVGDEKQRIMGWARALEGVFSKFSNDFSADTKRLVLNHRSSPKLVAIQNIISKNLEQNSIEVSVPDKWGELDGTCEIWAFESSEDEAICLADEVINWINTEGIKPRDVCIIVKQQEDIYGAAFKNRLAEQGVQAREEKEYQDLLSEEIVQVILNMIILAIEIKAPDSRKVVIDFLFYVNGFDENTKYQVLYEFEDQLGIFIADLNKKLIVFLNQLEKVLLNEIIYMIINFIDKSKIKNSFPQYSRGNYLDEMILNLIHKIDLTMKIRNDWKLCVEDICGEYSIPMMTIHKSKGLEYDTVIFVGLEDAAFWNFENNSEEDKRAFFVALSRAKNRVIFTASKVRKILNRDRNLMEQEQSVRNITTLYRILKEAGVPIIRPTVQNSNYLK
ncbi:UvrD-helicase domain-containing protein [Paenibacillus glucanolyticus]|uniref:UvrD-helicase domain-containing protein n=2 Tax=Paenibacillus glucanolyticus TaxID=59843 RepID=UPI003690EC2D